MSNTTGPLQLDLIGYAGLKTTRALRTTLDHVDRLARFHDQQLRRDAVISITPRQARELTSTLQYAGRELRWRSHRLRIVDE